jgi:hypothetical protein
MAGSVFGKSESSVLAFVKSAEGVSAEGVPVKRYERLRRSEAILGVSTFGGNGSAALKMNIRSVSGPIADVTGFVQHACLRTFLNSICLQS